MSVNKVELARLPFSNCNYDMMYLMDYYIERILLTLILRHEGCTAIDSGMKSVLAFMNTTNGTFVWSEETP